MAPSGAQIIHLSIPLFFCLFMHPPIHESVRPSTRLPPILYPGSTYLLSTCCVLVLSSLLGAQQGQGGALVLMEDTLSDSPPR